MARLVGLMVKAYCGGNDDSGWSVESTATGGRKLEGKGSSQQRSSPLHSTRIFCVFGKERKKNCIKALFDGSIFA